MRPQGAVSVATIASSKKVAPKWRENQKSNKQTDK